jgi:hypothetical protein
MYDDFKPNEPVESLQAKLDELNKPVKQVTETAEITEPTAEIVAPDTKDRTSVINPETDEVISKKSRMPFKLKLPQSRKQWIMLAVVVLLIVGGVFGWLSSHKSKPAIKVITVKAVVKPKIVVPTTVASTLSGLLVDPSINARPVTGVMIENSQDARPQSGLSQASVVFEAIAEGGITRFLALFQDTAPDNVGPIRSARPYYLQWALGFEAGYAHVGGSPEAIQDIKDWGVRDLDQFYNSGSYHRVNTRIAPHNVYTGITTLTQLEASKGYTSSNFTGFIRKADSPAKVPTASTVNINISGPVYNASYAYSAPTNNYLRSEAGAPHIDANTNAQISPRVVIALVMPYSLEADGYHSDYSTIGTGQAFIFQDGLVTVGQWSKTSNASQFTFTDSNGVVVKLNPGQTWLTTVANATDVTYAP